MWSFSETLNIESSLPTGAIIKYQIRRVLTVKQIYNLKMSNFVIYIINI